MLIYKDRASSTSTWFSLHEHVNESRCSIQSIYTPCKCCISIYRTRDFFEAADSICNDQTLQFTISIIMVEKWLEIIHRINQKLYLAFHHHQISMENIRIKKLITTNHCHPWWLVAGSIPVMTSYGYGFRD